MKVKKISDRQFTLDVINKGFEIAGNPLKWDTFEDLVEYSKNNPEWFSEAVFTNVEQYFRWKDYFFEHFSDWKAKGTAKRIIEKEFSWFSLCYGPKFDFDTSLIRK